MTELFLDDLKHFRVCVFLQLSDLDGLEVVVHVCILIALVMLMQGSDLVVGAFLSDLVRIVQGRQLDKVLRFLLLVQRQRTLEVRMQSTCIVFDARVCFVF